MKLKSSVLKHLILSLARVDGRSRQRSSLGFTLTEVLVSMIIAAIIMSGLMTLMVELLTSDARETARNETQQEMQMALEYVSADIREAVHVYDGECLEGSNDCAGFADAISRDNSVPVLAFWKLEDLPDAVRNAQCVGGEMNHDNQVPCVSGRSYTLIVYYLTRNDEGNGVWSGLGRLQRGRLASFTNSNQPNFQAPYSGNEELSFRGWQPENVNSMQVTTLVDFVDSRAMNEIPELQDAGGASVQCPDSHVITPSDGILASSGFPDMRNFYACIRDDSVTADDPNSTGSTQVFNQKVILFLRGNAAGKAGIRDANIGFMPAIQTQVLNRSVREKTPRRF
ncbi:MAG: prepilin-type N-terminal cleavage/methylation domain-containing protein [Phormidium sp. GEM2.Bin31]|nr:MAG: prepilin-type N-terminal cleavage/methylation domain-containing protein [Phormidium sp. GEM2.Bin31]